MIYEYTYIYISHQFLLFKSINHQKLVQLKLRLDNSFDQWPCSDSSSPPSSLHRASGSWRYLHRQRKTGRWRPNCLEKSSTTKKHHQNTMKPKKHAQKWNEHLRDYPNLLMRKLDDKIPTIWIFDIPQKKKTTTNVNKTHTATSSGEVYSMISVHKLEQWIVPHQSCTRFFCR